jgi:hypothetical protein
VFFEVQAGGQVFHPAQPVRMQAVITHKPPGPGDTYVNPFLQPVELLDANGNPTGVRILAERHTPNPIRVVGRHVFYNRSFFDGNNPQANPNDDNAIDTTKTALLPGQTGSFANYTAYSRGINGLMIDIPNAPNTIPTSSFTFRHGNNNNPASWPVLNIPAGGLQVSVRPGAGVGGSNRVTLILPDGLVTKRWLQVTVAAGPSTGLESPDVFYWGNAIGETGNSLTDAIVSANDEAIIRVNFTTGFQTVPVTSRHDINKDRFVTAADAALSRVNQTTAFSALRLIAPPAEAGGGGGGLAALSDGLDSQDLIDLLAATRAKRRAR